MINWIKSAEINNCTVEDLKVRFVRFPSSNKKIVTNCNICNEERKLSFCDYRGDDNDLCQPCSTRTIEARDRQSRITIERYSDQSVRDDFSARMVAYWSILENRDAQSDLKKQFYIDNPESLDEISKRTIEQFSTQESRLEMSCRMKEYYEDPEHRKQSSEARIKYLKSHPDNIKKMIGGHDIIMHHYLYDDADLSKYTMPMTRSDHGKMHRRMQLDGYKVSHINSGIDDNGLWGYKSW